MKKSSFLVLIVIINFLFTAFVFGYDSEMNYSGLDNLLHVKNGLKQGIGSSLLFFALILYNKYNERKNTIS